MADPPEMAADATVAIANKCPFKLRPPERRIDPANKVLGFGDNYDQIDWGRDE